MRQLLLACLALSGCGVLVVEGKPETRHRYYAVYSDDGDAIVVADESYLWNCSGTMTRCYNHESDYHLMVYQIDPESPAKRDTLADYPGGRAFPGGYADPILYLSPSRDRLLYAYRDSSGREHQILSSADGSHPFDFGSLAALRDKPFLSLVPSPGFDRAAYLAYGKGREMLVYFLDMDTRASTDSIRIPMSPADTTPGTGHGMLWESDSSLVVYNRTYTEGHAGLAYRVRGGRVTDTIPEWGCLPLHVPSGGPYDESGTRIEMTDSGLVKRPQESWRCRP